MKLNERRRSRRGDETGRQTTGGRGRICDSGRGHEHPLLLDTGSCNCAAAEGGTPALVKLLRLELKAKEAAEDLLVGMEAGTAAYAAVTVVADDGAKAAACPFPAVHGPFQHSPLLSNRPPEQKHNKHGETGLLTPSRRGRNGSHPLRLLLPTFSKGSSKHVSKTGLCRQEGSTGQTTY